MQKTLRHWPERLFNYAVNAICKMPCYKEDIRKVNVRIDLLDEKLTNKIDEVDQRLSSQIAEVDERLTNEIREVDRRLSERMDGLDLRMDKLENKNPLKQLFL